MIRNSMPTESNSGKRTQASIVEAQFYPVILGSLLKGELNQLSSLALGEGEKQGRGDENWISSQTVVRVTIQWPPYHKSGGLRLVHSDGVLKPKLI